MTTVRFKFTLGQWVKWSQPADWGLTQGVVRVQCSADCGLYYELFGFEETFAEWELEAVEEDEPKTEHSFPWKPRFARGPGSMNDGGRQVDKTKENLEGRLRKIDKELEQLYDKFWGIYPPAMVSLQMAMQNQGPTAEQLGLQISKLRALRYELRQIHHSDESETEQQPSL